MRTHEHHPVSTAGYCLLRRVNTLAGLICSITESAKIVFTGMFVACFSFEHTGKRSKIGKD